MEVRNLVTFLKVTELKSFSRAAEALDYSQSAVTVQIQQLERELGVQLFDRIGKTVSITQYGKDFVSYARDVVSAIARASAFASSDSELSGTVRVGHTTEHAVLLGADERLGEVMQMEMLAGTLPNAWQCANAEPVAVVGDDLAQTL